MSFTHTARAKFKADARVRRQSARGAAKRTKLPVTRHPLFAPLIGVWGAAAGGLSVMVMPSAVVAPLGAIAVPAAGPGVAQIAFAGASALTLGLACYAAGWLISRRRRTGFASTARKAGRSSVQPIDPASELGSERLDSPLDDDAWRDHHDAGEDDTAWVAWIPNPSESDAAGFAEDDFSDFGASGHDEDLWPVADQPAARGLDLLAELADLPGRDEERPETQPELAEAEPQPASHESPAAPTAIERLREVPPAELSLCQMIERFAVALQEYQEAHPSDEHRLGQDTREAVLAEALKALGQVTGQGFDELAPAGGAQMRAAMWAQAQRAQDERGAA